ncbi:hypothetical protein DCS_00187 [Drechmeria coniospora]|uniref:Uncharacterized protein n=1 Tax=Drechmeria coniospora TaxID=98403 RepID=A0A151GPP8_DRECN|nr:hypothetical protein DCS_00187 [Drechmeria coniospora]KYK59060.1 hypothetical protein DCS_00187 [Drechmeria coniospora]
MARIDWQNLDVTNRKGVPSLDGRILGQGVLAASTGGELVQVAQRAVGNLHEGLLGEEGLVTADEDVVKGGEAHEQIVLDDLGRVIVVEELALALVDVEGDAAEVIRLEGADDGPRVEEAAAGGVDEHGARLHLGDGVGVDDVLGRVHERAVEADDVALGEELVERPVLAHVGKGGRGKGIVGDDAAAEALHDAAGGDADPAGADDADRLAVEGAPDEAVEGEVALADAVVGAVRVAVERLDEGDGELGDGLGRVGGHVGDEQAAGVGGVEVDVVEAGAAQEDGLDGELGEGLDDGSVDGVVDEDADGVGAAGEEDGVLAQGKVVVDDFKARLRSRGLGVVKVLFVVRLGAEDGELHRGERERDGARLGSSPGWEPKVSVRRGGRMLVDAAQML